ncbi:hypothetical protein [Plastoroseomonas hellenica]|uniref:Uncharacterized protein n=1 Tax=Plastoroseomonas hellenica TaxID=2687306 RepID=A0ABS5EWM2_9PROT|nr:hypothetical protein [Plastoroseomonas hellenica]MBR0641224.1 hypothetical protein [Plastoroseomonas hellenica]MBR0664692.1 hypothetical protein [Plastoroseomonas hellenica]
MGAEDPEFARTESEGSQILRLLHAQTALLRALTEQITALIQMLTPGEREGPSLDELIARLISLVQAQGSRMDAQGATLDRIEAKLTALGTDLPPALAQAVLRTSRNRDLA